MVDIERIRYAHFREGSSIRELARAFHHSRTTIRRALDDPGPWTYRRTRRRPAPVMDAVAPLIEAWLAADEAVHHKQRHTARRIWQRLVAEHEFAGGEPTVRAWVRAHRRASLRGVTIPLAHDPGAEALCRKPHRASYAASANMRREATTTQRGDRAERSEYLTESA